MPRRWTRREQIALEKPRPPHVPTCCPQCGCRWYVLDEDDDWICLMCGRTLLVLSRYHYEMRKWKAGLDALAEPDRYSVRGARGRFAREDEAA